LKHYLPPLTDNEIILLMENGQIYELGTHEQLMTQGGVYAKMYHEQASWYE